MKTYVYKELIWSISFLFVFFSVFAYALIWLNQGFKVDDIISQYEIRMENKVDILNNSIMPACFKGRK